MQIHAIFAAVRRQLCVDLIKMLAIVRYGHGIGLNELKLAYATETDTTFADGTVQRDVPLLHNSLIWHVSYDLLSKKHIVQSVVQRDLDALTSVLNDEAQQVRIVTL